MLDKKIKKQIVEYENYGVVNICLNEIMEKKQISTYELSINTDIKFQTIKSLRENKAQRISLDNIAKLCFVLDITPSELIKYTLKGDK